MAEELTFRSREDRVNEESNPYETATSCTLLNLALSDHNVSRQTASSVTTNSGPISYVHVEG